MDVEGGTVTRVGVALSGGGHRASVWAAGLLLYLADAGRNGDIGVIASVSGGSITNGVVAQQMDYRQARADEVRDGLGPLLHHIAYTGLFFWGPSTNLYGGIALSLVAMFPSADIELEHFTNSKTESREPVEPRRAHLGRSEVEPGSYSSGAIVLLTDGQRTTGGDPLDAA